MTLSSRTIQSCTLEAVRSLLYPGCTSAHLTQDSQQIYENEHGVRITYESLGQIPGIMRLGVAPLNTTRNRLQRLDLVPRARRQRHL